MGLLSDMATDLLGVASDCLASTVGGTPTDAFTAHGPNRVPRSLNCDHLYVRWGQIAPTLAFPSAWPGNQSVQGCNSIGRSVTYVIHLRRHCEPRLRGDGTFPPADEMSAAANGLADDAEQLWCCVLGTYAAGALFLDPNIPDEPLPLVPGTMTPTREASMWGIDWPLTVGLDACCYTSGASGS